ncbi:MAG: restriction endonuclease subunit S [Leptospiraceae bacterium]|nr:restriction endonuclease subunit S [Leptospiraceae bacterium]MCP5496359.1 restriction endonuclease subunit S [Leptospiraceae bacterium]
MNVKEIVLQDLISFTKDGEWGKDKDTGSSIEMYVIRGTDFQDVKAGYFGNLPIRWIPKHIAEKKTLEAGDVLIELAGGTEDNPTGRTCYVSEEFIANSDRPLTVASFSRFIRFDNSICDSNYIYWMLHFLHKYRIIKKYHVQHTGTSRFQWTLFSNKEKIKVHEFPIQHKIANILSAYDDLIENNKKRIKLLEEMAEEIYKEWFVRMRFPGYEKTKFFNEQGKQVPFGTNGALPEGWEKVKLESALERVKRMPKVSTDQYLSEGLFPIIDQGDSIIAGYTNDESFVQFEPLPLVIFGDHTRRVKYVNFPFAAGADGTQFLYPKNKSLLPIYFFIAVKNIDLSNFHYARHFKFLKQEYIIIPDEKIVLTFNDLTKPFFDEIRILSQKNLLLQETRDLLLPRLMSGKLSVEELA